MRRTNSRSRSPNPVNAIASRLQVSLDLGKPLRRRVFDDADRRPQESHDPAHFPPQAGVGTGQADSLSMYGGGDAGLLAREPAADDIDLPLSRVAIGKRPHVVMTPNVRPVLGQHPPAKLTDLHLPTTLHPGPLKPQIETRRCPRTSYRR